MTFLPMSYMSALHKARRVCKPFGPRVTLTAFASTSTPLRMLALPSFENLISLWAPRASEGTALRRDLAEEVDRRCIAAKSLVESEPCDRLNFRDSKYLEFHVILLCNIVLPRGDGIFTPISAGSHSAQSSLEPEPRHAQYIIPVVSQNISETNMTVVLRF